MGEKNRKTGIDIIGEVPWGTHFCQFYETKEDLFDILVPYFKTGLENNEFCIWVTSEPLSEKDAKKALRKAVPNFDMYLKEGQIEIVPYTGWYLRDGGFDQKRVLNALVDKLDRALTKGYDGMRATGNTTWLEKRDWKDFTDYEREVNEVIRKDRMMAISTYSLEKCRAFEVIDVLRNHQFALVKRGSGWEVLESLERKKPMLPAQDAQKYTEDIVETVREPVVVSDTGLEATSAKRLSYNPLKMISKSIEREMIYEMEERQLESPRWRELLGKIFHKSLDVDEFGDEHEFPSIWRWISRRTDNGR